MKIADYNILREYNRQLMPDYMYEYEKERAEEIQPVLNIPKSEYITEWVMLFDEGCFNGMDVVSTFIDNKILHLKKAFEWSHSHFAELCLGGDMQWLSATCSILEHLKNKTWTKANERKLIIECMKETLWFED